MAIARLYASANHFEHGQADILLGSSQSCQIYLQPVQTRLSFYHLDKIFNTQNSLRSPLVQRNENGDSLGYGRLIVTTMMILNDQPRLAWNIF